MSPASGMEPRNGEARTAVVQLVQAQRVPGQRGAFLAAKVQGLGSQDSSFLFEPSQRWLESSGVQMERSLLHPDPEGLVLIPISNPAADPIRFPIGE